MLNIQIPIESEMLETDILLPNTGGHQKSFPLVIFIHGFKGNKNWGFIPELCNKISESGFICVKYNHSFSGYYSENSNQINVEKFEQMTISRQLEDLDLLIDRLLENEEVSRIFSGDIILIGHSMGGGISLLYSLTDSRIKKIVLLAPIAYFDRYTERQKSIWKESVLIEFPNAKTGQMLRLKAGFLLDLENNIEKFNLLSAVKQLNIPIKLIHGLQDMTVKAEEAQKLINANPKIDADFIDAASHSFNIDTKGIRNNPILNKVIAQCIKFLKADNE